MKNIISGLEFVVEIQRLNSKQQPLYFCELCPSLDSYSVGGFSVIRHVIGKRHILSFFVSNNKFSVNNKKVLDSQALPHLSKRSRKYDFFFSGKFFLTHENM